MTAVGKPMVFNSLLFPAFLAAALLARYSPMRWEWRKLALLALSYGFYACWIPAHLILLLALTGYVQFIALQMGSAASPTRRSWLLTAGVVGSLCPLLFYKYALFLSSTFVRMIGGAESGQLSLLGTLLLPVGISFYTFEAISYLVDVFRSEGRGRASLLDFALFLAFFPRMVAGPIMRASAFVPQCLQPTPCAPSLLVTGSRLLILGLFEKIVLADWLFAPTADRVFQLSANHDLWSTWTGVIAFAFQIFFDFAGYSTAAVGVARMLGFDLPLNFNSPYAAANFSEFWKRWHISLSSWLRDYVYIPLGGNRGGRWRTHLNLTATMLIGGLWHGAALRFIAWGGLHGLLLVAQREVPARLTVSRPGPVRTVAATLLVFLCVCLTWVFFRATSLGHALTLCQAMMGLGSGESTLPGLLQWGTLALASVCLACHWLSRHESIDEVFNRWPASARVGALGAMVMIMLLSPDDNRTFIYFQF